MAEYLRLVSEGKVRVEPLIAATYPIEHVTEAYESLKGEGAKPLVVLLSYPNNTEDTHLLRVIPNPTASPAGTHRIKIAIAGAGGFSKGMHLPNLQSLSSLYHIQAIMSRTGHNAVATAKQFNARYATTDYQQILDDPEINAVLIATRHNLHAAQDGRDHSGRPGGADPAAR